LAITSPTSGGRSVGIVRLRTQTMELTADDKINVPNLNILKIYINESQEILSFETYII
jgi:hypothetical protein